MKHNCIKSIVYFVAYLVIIFSSSSYAEQFNVNPFSVVPGTKILAGGNPPNTSPKTFMDMTKKAKQLNINSVKGNIVNNLGEKGKEITQTYLERYFPTVELELDMLNGEKPTSSILILAPLSDPKDTINTFFTQDSIYYTDNRTTVNLGVGYRRLELDKKLLLGINAFYDHEFPYNHQRASIGLEARTTVGELNANFYESLTDWRDGRDGLEEHGLDGRDIEIGIPLPYINWAYFFAQAFQWDSEVAGVKDISGTNLTIRATPPGLRGLEIEFGRTDYGETSSNKNRDANFFKISVNLTDWFKKSNNTAPLISSVAYQLGDMEAKRYEKVRRTNLIYKQMKGQGVTVSGF